MKHGLTQGHEGFLSRMMLGLIFMLLVMAHVALPCAMATRSGRAAGPRGGMCTESKFFRGGTDTNQYFLVPMPRPPQLDAIVALAWLPIAAFAVAAVTRPRRPLAYVSTRGRPFISSTPSFLPYFAARADA